MTTIASKAPKQTTEYRAPGVPFGKPLASAHHNILKIVPSSFFADYGCHVRIYEETRVLQSRGNRVTICTYHTGGDVPGVDIHRALNTPWRRSVQVGSSKHKLYYDALLSAKVGEVALRKRPSVIHGHLHEGALIGYPVSRVHRIPLVFDFQGSLTSEMLDHRFIHRDSAFFRPLRKLEWVIDRMPDAIITSSLNAADVLLKDFGCSHKKIYTISDRVNPDFFRSKWDVRDEESIRKLRARLGIPDDRKVVVYLGLLAEYQGVGKLLEAARLIIGAGKPVHFLIMGFPAVEMYQRMADQLGIAGNTTFTGRVPYWDAPDHLLVGDVAVSPKMSETEGNGKLLNYMSVGLPTVCFNTPVAREILGDLGIYATLGDAKSLASCLQEALADETAIRQRGRALRRRAVKHYSWTEAGQLIEEVYHLVCR